MSKNILEKIIEKKKEKINYLKKNFDVNFLHDFIILRKKFKKILVIKNFQL